MLFRSNANWLDALEPYSFTWNSTTMLSGWSFSSNIFTYTSSNANDLSMQFDPPLSGSGGSGGGGSYVPEITKIPTSLTELPTTPSKVISIIQPTKISDFYSLIVLGIVSSLLLVPSIRGKKLSYREAQAILWGRKRR